MRHPHTLLRTLILGALAALVLFPLSTATLPAQQSAPFPQWFVGVTGALTHNSHGGNGATGFESDCWWDAPSGRALGYAAGIVGGASIDDDLSIVARATWSTRDGMVINRRTDARTVTNIGHGDTVTTIVSEDSIMYRNELVVELVTLEALVEGRIVQASPTVAIDGSIGVAVGGIVRGTATRAREMAASVREGRVAANEGETVENDGRRVVYERDREVPGLRDLRLSLKGGLGFDVALAPALTMKAGVYHDLGVTALTSQPLWTLSSTLVQIDLLLHL